jgi:hypothetical protein
VNGRRRSITAAVVCSLLALGFAGCGHPAPLPVGLPCHAVAGAQTFALDTDQAANATTIAAVGKTLGMPDHAVTVALAAALQESKLYNLDYGDHDSLGLFQQRPSQGWGTAAQVMDPRYASTAFFTHLGKIAGWETLPVTDAVQAVQHSAAPDAYAQWEDEARVLAQAITGELPAAFACQTFGHPPAPAPPAVLSAGLAADLGTPTVGAAVDVARGWQVASWLVAHAGQYGVSTVVFAGLRWSGHTGQWKPHLPAANTVEVNR